MGDVNNGTFTVGLTFRPIHVETPDTQVTFNYLITNTGHHDEASIDSAVSSGLQELAKAGGSFAGAEVGAAVGSFAGPIGTAIGALFGQLATLLGGFLVPDCDGPVAIEQVTLTGQQLWDATASGGVNTHTVDQPGIDSADGCGSNSQYTVFWSIRGGQADWRYCQKCGVIFFDGFPGKGVCPGGGGHEAAGYDFILPHDTPEPGQEKWRYCQTCGAMFFDGFPGKGVCPGGGGHEASGFNFVLPHG
jgi:hypothetical protein